MRKRIHQKLTSSPKTMLWGRQMYALSEKEAEKMREAASGDDRYAVNQEFRELIEEKSRFIPKIWGDIE